MVNDSGIRKFRYPANPLSGRSVFGKPVLGRKDCPRLWQTLTTNIFACEYPRCFRWWARAILQRRVHPVVAPKSVWSRSIKPCYG